MCSLQCRPACLTRWTVQSLGFVRHCWLRWNRRGRLHPELPYHAQRGRHWHHGQTNGAADPTFKWDLRNSVGALLLTKIAISSTTSSTLQEPSSLLSSWPN